MEAGELDAALRAVGELLAADEEHAAIVVVGGATLNLLGLVQRATSDVDVIARAFLDPTGELRLDVGLVGRRTLVHLKLFASVDRGPRSVHAQDLIALSPTDEELKGAAAWVLTQDAAPEWGSLLKEAMEHVERHRQ